MQFQEAVQIEDKAERDEEIHSQINEFFWEDEIGKSFPHGGYCEDASVEDIAIEEDDDNIIALVQLSYYESVPTACKDVNRRYARWSKCKLNICRRSGDHDIEELDSGEDRPGASDVY